MDGDLIFILWLKVKGYQHSWLEKSVEIYHIMLLIRENLRYQQAVRGSPGFSQSNP